MFRDASCFDSCLYCTCLTLPPFSRYLIPDHITLYFSLVTKRRSVDMRVVVAFSMLMPLLALALPTPQESNKNLAKYLEVTNDTT
jgi:hypothetical protein